MRWAGVYGEPIAMLRRSVGDSLHKFNEELRLTSNPGISLFGNPARLAGGRIFHA